MSSTAAGRTIVTAADHRYFRTLCQLLLSAERHDAAAAFEWLVVDLGLSGADRAQLAARFPWCRVEPFDFDRYPPHVRRLAICAWKPIAIDEVMNARGGFVLWLDSATIIHAPLEPIVARLAQESVIALAGQSPNARWCHPATLRFMRVPESDAAARCRSAGVLGFDAGNGLIRALVDEWRAFALVEACIDPPGAGRANHRYDQAILSNLLCALARDHGLRPADDEIDISSVAPVGWVSTRNTVASWIPLALDPLVRAYYALYKQADRVVLRWSRAAGS